MCYVHEFRAVGGPLNREDARTVVTDHGAARTYSRGETSRFSRTIGHYTWRARPRLTVGTHEDALSQGAHAYFVCDFALLSPQRFGALFGALPHAAHTVFSFSHSTQ